MERRKFIKVLGGAVAISGMAPLALAEPDVKKVYFGQEFKNTGHNAMSNHVSFEVQIVGNAKFGVCRLEAKADDKVIGRSKPGYLSGNTLHFEFDKPVMLVADTEYIAYFDVSK